VTLAHFVREVDVQLSHLGSSRQGHRFGFLGFFIKKSRGFPYRIPYFFHVIPTMGFHRGPKRKEKLHPSMKFF
jgi:hypothetical protein